jgi:Rrf2 family iron-sulfur cluster assembly transcriptional regulator
MLYSTGTGYALRALAALPEDGAFLLARDLAEKAELPAPYLSKVLQTLSAAGLLESARGPRGGFRLARKMEGITVGEVVATLNAVRDDACVMGFTDCASRYKPCPLHAAWAEAKEALDRTMAQVTLRDLRGADLSRMKVIPRVRCEKGPA